MMDLIDAWLKSGPDITADPSESMREAGLLSPVDDYMSIARGKAALTESTGLLGIGSIWGGPQLVFRHFLSFGSVGQRAQWAGRALSVAISEPKVGAHPKRLTCKAEPTDGGYLLTGKKAWVSNGPTADAIIVFAITGVEDGRKRYSAFIVPSGTAGLSITDMQGFQALRPSRHCLVTFDTCFLPRTAMLGEPGSAYERMALPFRDIEDAVGTFGTHGAMRHAVSLLRGSDLRQDEKLGAIVALMAVFAAGAQAVVSALDGGRFGTGDAVLVGLRLLAMDIVAKLRDLETGAPDILTDLDASLDIARGPRLARQAALGQAALRPEANAA